MITLKLTPPQFAYLRAAVERDMEEARLQIMLGTDDDEPTHVFNQAKIMLHILPSVEDVNAVLQATEGGE